MGEFTGFSSELLKEGPSGVNALATTLVPFVQAGALDAFNNAYKISQVLPGPEFVKLRRWTRNENMLVMATGTASVAHGALREATNYLQHLLFRNLEGPIRILVLNATWKQAKIFSKALPTAGIRFAVCKSGNRDTQRIRSGMLAARGEKNPAMQILANQFISAAQGFNSAYFTFYDQLKDLLPYKYDAIVCIDGLLRYHPSEIQKLVVDTSCEEFYATMHYCPELFKLKKTIHNQYFDYQWRQVGKQYVMHFEDASYDYTHEAAICKAWWRRNRYGNLFWDPVHAKGGYGLFKFGLLEQGIHTASKMIFSLEDVYYLFRLPEFFEFGKITPIIVTRSKYEDLLHYCDQVMSGGGPIDWGKLVLFARSHKGKSNPVGKIMISEWDFYDEDLLDIIAFVILEFSVKKAEILDLFPQILTYVKNDGRFSLLTRWFVFPWRKFTERIKRFMYGPRAVEAIQRFKNMDPAIEVDLLDQLAAVKMNFDNFAFNLLHYTSVGGFVNPEAMTDFKREILHYIPYNPEGQTTKVMNVAAFGHILKGKTVLTLQTDQGDSIRELARAAGQLIVPIVSKFTIPNVNLQPNFAIKWEELDEFEWKFNRNNIVVDPKIEYSHFATIYDALKKSKFDVVVANLACCNGTDCEHSGYDVCPIPFMWFRFWKVVVKLLNVKVILKMDTPDLDCLYKLVAGKSSVRASVLGAGENQNPMSFERYWLLEPVFLTFGQTKQQFYGGFQTVINRWEAYRVFVKSWSPLKQLNAGDAIDQKISPRTVRAAIAHALEPEMHEDALREFANAVDEMDAMLADLPTDAAIGAQPAEEQVINQPVEQPVPAVSNWAVNPMRVEVEAKAREEEILIPDVHEEPVKKLFGISKPNFSRKPFDDSELGKHMKNVHLCAIEALGLCAYKAFSALLMGCQEEFSACYSTYIAKILGEPVNKMPLNISVEDVKLVAEKLGVPYFNFVDNKSYLGTKDGRARSFGALLIFIDHADVALQMRISGNERFTKVHPYVRPFVPLAVERMQFVNVKFTNHTKLDMKTVAGLQAAAFVAQPYDRFYDIHCAAIKVAESAAVKNAQPRVSKIFVIQGGPGACKTETALELAHNHKLRYGKGTVLYIASSGPARAEFIERYCQKYCASHTDDMQKLGVWAKTFVAAVAPKLKESYVVPNANMQLIILDEAFTNSVVYLQYLSALFINAKFVLLGDLNQMMLDTNKIWSDTINVKAYQIELFLKDHKILQKPDYSGWHSMNVSKRFGPRAVHLAKKTFPDAELYCDNLAEFKVMVKGAHELKTTMANHDLVMTASVDGYSKADQDLGIQTIRKSQGLSQTSAVLIMDEPTAMCFESFPNNAYVAVTRCKQELAIVKVDPTAWANHNMSARVCLADYRSKMQQVLGHVGGEHWIYPQPFHEEMDSDWLQDNFTNGPQVTYPTVLNHSIYPKRKPIEHSQFHVADLNILEQLEEGNIMEHTIAIPGEIGSVNICGTKVVGKTWKGKTITENFPGNRHTISSMFQNIATVVHRTGVAKKIQSKYKRVKTTYHMLQNYFMKFFIDERKYDEVMQAPVTEYFTASAINEFRRVMKLSKLDAEVTMRDFMWSATEHLKTQAKAKDVESTLKGKPGQPVVAPKKCVNIVFSPIFRVCKKLFLACLNSKVIWASGLTPETIAELWAEGNYKPKWILENDYPEFDASQTEETHHGEFLVWMLFNPFGRVLEEYFIYTKRTFVIGDALSFIALGQRMSGFPDTFDGNTLKQLIDWMMSGLKGPAGLGWFNLVTKILIGGDDSAIALKAEPKKVFNFDWLNKLLYSPLKINVVTHGVAEFSNWFLAGGLTVYNPLQQVKKILLKNYTDVLATREKWLEYTDSFNTMLWNVRDHLFECVEMASIRLDWSLEFSEYIFRTLEAFASMGWSQAKRLLKPDDIVFEDFHCGGAKDLYEEVEQLSQVEQMAANNAVNKVLEFVQKNARATTPLVQYSMTGPSHCPEFECYVNMKNGDRDLEAKKTGATKAEAKLKAFSAILELLQNPNRTPRIEIVKKGSEEVIKKIELPKMESDSSEDFVKSFLTIFAELGFAEAFARTTKLASKIQTWSKLALHLLFTEVPQAQAKILWKAWFLQKPYITYREYVQAGRNVWVCCKCDAHNISSREEAPICCNCDVNVDDHITFKFVAFGSQEVAKFGEPLEIKLEQRQPKLGKRAAARALKRAERKVEAKVEKKVEQKLRAPIGKPKAAKPKIPRKIVRTAVEKVDRSKWTELEKKILRGYVDPKNNLPERLALPMNDVETAVDNTFLQFKPTWGTTAGDQIPHTDQLIIKRHSPCINTIFYDSWPSGNDWRYDMYSLNHDDEPQNGTPGVSFTRSLLGGVFQNLNFSFWRVNGAEDPYGPLIAAFRLKNQDLGFSIFQEHEDVTFAATNVATGNTLEVQAFRYTGSEVEAYAKVTGAESGGSASCTFTIEANGAYAFQVTTVSDDNITLSVRRVSDNAGLNTGVWRILMMPEAETLMKLGSAIGMHGSDLMYTCTSDDLHKSGQIVSVQVSGGNEFINYLFGDKTSHYDDFANMKKAHPTLMKEGAHIFRKPVNREELQLKQYCKINVNGVLTEVWDYLDDNTDYLIIYATGEASVSNVGRITTANTFEFRNNSQLFELKSASMHYRVFEDALDKLKRVQQSHTNGGHDSALAKGINSALQFGEALMPFLL